MIYCYSVTNDDLGTEVAKGEIEVDGPAQIAASAIKDMCADDLGLTVASICVWPRGSLSGPRVMDSLNMERWYYAACGPRFDRVCPHRHTLNGARRCAIDTNRQFVVAFERNDARGWNKCVVEQLVDGLWKLVGPVGFADEPR